MIWIVVGTFGALKPEGLKNKMRKKIDRKMKRVVYAFIFVFGFSLVASVFKMHGIISKIVAVVGLFVLIKGIMLVTSKTSEKVFTWWAERPLGYFRMLGLILIGTGCVLLFA